MVDIPSLAADDLEAIRRVKARYCRGVDTKDWDLVRSLFTDDARIGPIESGLPASLLERRPPSARRIAERLDVDDFLTRIAENLADVVSTHHVHQSEIALTETDAAEATWAMSDILFWPDTGVRFSGTGHYRETYRRTADGWRIRSLTLTRLDAFVVPSPPA